MAIELGLSIVLVVDLPVWPRSRFSELQQGRLLVGWKEERNFSIFSSEWTSLVSVSTSWTTRQRGNYFWLLMPNNHSNDRNNRGWEKCEFYGEISLSLIFAKLIHAFWYAAGYVKPYLFVCPPERWYRVSRSAGLNWSRSKLWRRKERWKVRQRDTSNLCPILSSFPYTISSYFPTCIIFANKNSFPE